MSCPFPAVAALLVLAAVPAQPGAGPIAATLARVRPSPSEDGWRILPWQRSLVVALALAEERDQPVFLFAYDGTLDDGNC